MYKILRRTAPIKEKKEKYFESLAPTILSDKTFSFYNDSLLWAVNNPDCFNIALSGIYGSGKSSIIRSFIHNNPDFEFLPISLGTLRTQKKHEPQTFEIQEKLEQQELSKLEKSILQQILYKVDEKKIPDSRFKRISKQNKTKLRIDYLQFFAICFLIFLLFNPRIFCYSWLPTLYDNYLMSTQSIISLLILMLSWKYFKRLHRSLRRITVEKLNLKNGEIGLKTDNNDSIFNNHLDEIVYFFDNNKFDIIVFEDLDRFDNLEIFVRLRELNLLLNQNENIKKKGKLTFLYAVKDDLFTDEQFSDRVKFFDFILPVISVINASNSFPKLKTLLTQDEMNQFDEEFLMDISNYVSDLRLLKNICNEFRIFQHLIRDQHELNYSQDKIFSIVMYKNLFPTDFNDLTRGKGIAYEFLSPKFKEDLIDSLLSSMDKDIEILTQDLDLLKGYDNWNENELKSFYLAKFIQKNASQYSAFKINEKPVNFDSITTEHFDVLFSNDVECYNQSSYNYNSSKFKLSEITDEKGNTYAQRKKLIGTERNSTINNLQFKIENIQREKTILKNRSIKTLFCESGFETKVSELKKDNPFLHHCLINGLIDENYQLYISHYIEGGLTINDLNFVQHVNESAIEKINFNYNLSRIDHLLKRISKDRYTDNRILNFQLLDFAIENNHIDLIKGFVNQILNWSSKSKLFYIESFEREKNSDKLSNELIKTNPDFIIKILDENFSVELKTRIIIMILINSTVEDIIKLKEIGALNRFLSLNHLLFNTHYIEPFDLVKICARLNLKFETITNDVVSESLSMIIINNFYRLTFENILFVINTNKSNELENINTLYSSFYTSIRETKLEYLIIYIHENIDEFISRVYLTLENEQHEKQEFFVELINLLDNKLDLIDDVISKNEIQIIDLSSINRFDPKSYLIVQRKVVPNWENIFESLKHDNEDEDIDNTSSTQYSTIGYNEGFIDFLNDTIQISIPDFGISAIPDVINSNDFNQLKLSIISNENLDDEIFEKILHSCNEELTDQIPFVDLSYEKIDILIKMNKLKLNEETFSFLNENWDELSEKLVISQFDTFINDTSIYSLNDTHVNEIIISEKLENTKKIIFLQNTVLPFDENKFLSSKVLDFANKYFALLNWNFDQCFNLVKYTEHKDQTVLKQFYLKTIESFSLNNNLIIDLTKALKITQYLNLFDLKKGTTEEFITSKENKRIFEFLNQKGIVGKVKTKANSNKLLVYKKRNF